MHDPQEQKYLAKCLTFSDKSPNYLFQKIIQEYITNSVELLKKDDLKIHLKFCR